MKDLSIIVVSYNTSKLLCDCLGSLDLDSKGIALEVYVVDNGSSDGSVEAVQHAFPSVQTIANDSNVGFAAANNQAMEMAMGRYVLLLNTDTVVRPGVLEAMVKYLDDNPDVGLAGCRVLNEDGTLQFSCTQEPSFLNLLLLTTGLSRLPWPRWFGRYQMRHWDHVSERDVEVISGCCLFARTEAINQVGLLDDSFFFFGEETDWCARFRKASWRVVYAPVGEIVHYGSASAVSLGHKRDLLLTSGLVRFHRKHKGAVLAALVWCLLLAFNATRCLFWALMAVLKRGHQSKERRNHFFDVLRNFTSAWPRHAQEGTRGV